MTGRTTDGSTADGGTRHPRAVASGERRGGGRDAAGWEGGREAPPLVAAAGLRSRRSLSTREGDATAAWAPCR